MLMTIDHPRPKLDFLATKAHARFEELATACSTYRYIGICHGRPGVGKTRSAFTYAAWTGLPDIFVSQALSEEQTSEIEACHAVFYTASVSNTPQMLDRALEHSLRILGSAKLRVAGEEIPRAVVSGALGCPLVIVDEADRLSLKSFEHLRDLYDQQGFGLILLGMPGLEKRLARYPQLYSRVGFVHEFKPLSDEEMRFLFERQSAAFGFAFNPDNFTEVEALAAIIRITRGNFRLIERLLAQMQRIMALNPVAALTVELVEAARDCLVIGPTA